MRIFNQVGKDKYQEWVIAVKNDTADRSDCPLHLLEDENTSIFCPTKVTWEPPEIGLNKYDFCLGLAPLIREFEQDSEFDKVNMPLVYDTIALKSFHLITPPKPKRLSGLEFYCFNDNSQRRYRHRIFGPLALVLAGQESVKQFFQVAPHQMGEYESNIGSRQQIAGNKSLLRSIATLYATPDSLKRGYTTTYKPKGFPKKVGKSGTIRRYGEITNQLTRVYDVYDIDPARFLGLLPDEFSGWINS